ncbi:dTDP-4-dehydrorhamnose reductase [Ottowia sp.]|uniref:dTDP-4-dehydrorhamnose reductase n=1 Tax=Ottowia sp. TaxID=1898956 RepID=UPI002C8AAB43|nr:dTDP-4-dehydrorhamnose reductase [Ottowia sp.]MCP5259043.1 dTDP-4-dehydrorhamnose reductase [Burkholderiaceae bacterium]HRW72618.1 dTDP-4-dehydrorhamnose reductase [Ottowia sp.]
MKILLLGKNGQVGWELQRSLAPLGELVALDRQGAPGLVGDVSDLDGLAATVRALRPQLIVNAAAHTAVDKAESEPDLARRLNAEAPAVLAREAAACGALLVHYSTDYVFDGSGERPWREDDATGPLGVYGRTKLEGEQAIAASGCRHLILRTSWVYAARGGNFAKTMLRLARERERLTVIDDQWGAPTGAELIADVTAQAVAQLRQVPGKGGLYHLAAAGATTWFEYAKYVLAQAQRAQPAIEMKVTEVAPIATRDYPTPARRPHNSRLDCTRLQAAFDLRLPPWQDGVRRMLAETL